MTIRSRDFNAMTARRAVRDLPARPKKLPRLLPLSVSPGVVVLPVRTVTESNAKEHWRTRHARAGNQRAITGTGMGRLRAAHGLPPFPVAVRLVRLAPGTRPMDDDNLPSAMKHVRDEIAAAYGVDDGDRRWRWSYDQERAGGYGVRVEIRAMGHDQSDPVHAGAGGGRR